MTKKSVIGTYINKDYHRNHCCLEAPHVPDTLVLKEDGIFISGFFGEGSYKLKNTLFNTDIKLRAKKIRYHTYFSNKFFESPMIYLNYDTNHHYYKID